MSEISQLNYSRRDVLEEFDKRFPDQQSCVEYFFNLRWPDGFTCSHCFKNQPDILSSQVITCSQCGEQTSLTSNTIMHGTKKPLRKWLQVLWWLCDYNEIKSAKNLQRLLGDSSYQTAWTWLQKCRAAMGRADVRRCKNVVELACHPVSPARGRQESALVLCAAEVILQSGITGLIRMQSINAHTPSTITAFLLQYVQHGSSIVIPQEDAYMNIKEPGYTCIISPQGENPFHADDMINSFELWLNRVHRGGVTLKHMPLYINEFCFNSNAALLINKEAVFEMLLTGVMNVKPRSYKELVS